MGKLKYYITKSSVLFQFHRKKCTKNCENTNAIVEKTSLADDEVSKIVVGFRGRLASCAFSANLSSGKVSEFLLSGQ